jgi:UDP-N-acetylmuramyl pentapeptide phosphotransferase/UDP-N-acetylglucosamine-1-phosphate transferase
MSALWQTGAAAAVLGFVACVGSVRLLIGYLLSRQILDMPNHRSSHKVPTPRGGGLAVTPVVVVLWAVLAIMGYAGDPWWMLAMVAGTVVLLFTSWWDDRHDLPALPRFGVHIACVMISLAALPSSTLVFQGWLPWGVDRAVVALGCIWFVNLYNFMDGIDGITGVETAAVGLGIAAVAAMTEGAGFLVPLSLVCVGAALGFLVWNWHPARIFLGDSGSVPLGFLLGGMLVQLAAAGQLAAALILPLYYLADATITLGRRALRREKVWQAHREHFYQRALNGGRSHAQVSRAVLVCNGALVGWAALAALGHSLPALAGAAVTVAGLLVLLQRWADNPAA